MTIKPKVVSVPFVGGLRQDSDELLQADGFVRLHNLRPVKDGSVSVVSGWQAIEFDEENALGEDDVEGSHDDEHPRIIRLGDAYGYVLNGFLYAESAGSLYKQGRVSPWTIDQFVVSDVASLDPADYLNGTLRHDSCINGDYLFTAFERPDGLLGVAVTNKTTFETVRIHTVGSIGGIEGLIRPHLARSAVAGTVNLVFISTSEDEIMRCAVDHEQVSVVSSLVAGPLTPNTEVTDFDVWGDGTFTYFAWADIANTNIVVQRFNSSWVEQAGQVYGAGGDYPIRVAVAAGSSDTVFPVAWVVYDTGAETQDLYTADAGTPGRSPDLLTALPSVALAGAVDTRLVNRLGAVRCIPDDPTTFFVSWHDPGFESGGSDDHRPVTRGQFVNNADGAALGGQNFCGRVQMTSKPWWDQSRACLMAASTSSAEVGGEEDRNRFFVTLAAERNQTGRRMRPLAHYGLEYAAPNEGIVDLAVTGNGFTVCTSPAMDGQHVFLTGLELDPGLRRFRLTGYRHNYNDPRTGASAQLGAATYITGGLLTRWDGLRAIEAGFLQEPVIERIEGTAGTLAAGERSYAVTFSRVSMGELLRSRPSQVVARTNTASQDNVLKITPLNVSLQSASDIGFPEYEVWRTTATDSSTFYLAYTGQLDPNTLAHIEITDDIADALLPTTYGISLPYTGSGGEELPNDAPICPVAIAEWRNRLWISDGKQIVYTKEADRRRQAEFSLLQTLPKAAGTDINGLVPVGQGLGVTTATTTGVVYGVGPDSAGSGSSLGGPTTMQQSVGNSKPGVMGRVGSAAIMHSETGLRLFTDAGQADRLGDEAEDVLDDGVLWVQSEGDDEITVLTEEDAVLLSLPSKTWSTLEKAGVVQVGERQVEAGPTLVVYEPQISPYELDTDPQVVTPWYRAAGDAGEMRVWRWWVLGHNVGEIPARLQLEVAYNYSDDYDTVATADLPDGEFTLRYTPNRQRCRAFRLRITVLPAEGETLLGDVRLAALRFKFAARRVAGALRTGDLAPNMVDS